MNENVIDPYGDFIEEKYFFDQFNAIPSELVLAVPVKGNQKNFEKVVSHIAEFIELETVLESWEISKYKDDEANDYVSMSFAVNHAEQICIKVRLDGDDLYLSFWYSKTHEKAFELVQAIYKNIRLVFGASLSPAFKILSHDGRSFDTEKISISKVEANISKNYNDDFAEVNELIQDSLQENKSGLILLHGKPGTGKTTYIKHLVGEHVQRNFIFIPNDFVHQLLKPEFVSFLLTQKDSILVIEDAEKVIRSREQATRDSVVSTILQLTDGLFSDYLNIKIICTFNTDLSNIDDALLRKGRMLAFYEFKELTLAKTNGLLESLNQAPSDTEMTLADIFYKSAKNFQSETKIIGF
ncbi:AAA family ATPase [Pontibacter sp. G13]|uniref:AAA family ATPase n=1 Tax=Pontibacter sp. G13 TaxID=3074898 RepID=UPI00288BC04C|nr:AAA family ATPase [Pontibacter sp. G13]WNJ17385.1 AAA family ATPase [Pontibacter sp. G13]